MPELSDKPKRHLPFPLDDSAGLQSEVPENGDFIDFTWQTEDSSERVTIQLELSQDEYTALASAVNVGSDIAYSTDADYIWWIWCRAFRGAIMVDCGEVADCFESEIITNTTLQNSITNAVNNFGFGNANHINGDITTIPDRNLPSALSENVAPLVECNLDVLWAGIRHGIVDRMDDACRDLLEDLALIPDAIERLAVFIDVVPVIGDIAQGLAFQVTEVIPDLIDLYNSYSSEATLDELACEIFALVCADCHYPTFNEIFDVYNSHAISGIARDGVTLSEIASLLLDLVGGGAKTAYFTLQVWQLWILFVQATFNGESGTNAILKYVHLGEDFANDNWYTLCDTCNEAYASMEFDYTKSQYGSTLAGGFSSGKTGTYVAGSGWRLDSLSVGSSLLTIAQPLLPSYVIRSVSFTASFPKTGYVAAFQLRANAGLAGTSLNISPATINPNMWCTAPFTPLTGFAEFAVRLSNNIAASNQSYLQKVRVIFVQPNSPPTATPTTDQTTCDEM